MLWFESMLKVYWISGRETFIFLRGFLSRLEGEKLKRKQFHAHTSCALANISVLWSCPSVSSALFLSGGYMTPPYSAVINKMVFMVIKLHLFLFVPQDRSRQIHTDSEVAFLPNMERFKVDYEYSQQGHYVGEGLSKGVNCLCVCVFECWITTTCPNKHQMTESVQNSDIDGIIQFLSEQKKVRVRASGHRDVRYQTISFPTQYRVKFKLVSAIAIQYRYFVQKHIMCW